MAFFVYGPRWYYPRPRPAPPPLRRPVIVVRRVVLPPFRPPFRPIFIGPLPYLGYPGRWY